VRFFLLLFFLIFFFKDSHQRRGSSASCPQTRLSLSPFLSLPLPSSPSLSLPLYCARRDRVPRSPATLVPLL
jgi:hypothetical protein